MVRTKFNRDVRSRAGDAIVKRGALILSLLVVLIPVSTLKAESSIKPFLGRWDLTVKAPGQELPSWIDVSEEQGQPKILMVGPVMHAQPLPKVQVKEGEIEFLSLKDAEGFPEDITFKGKLINGQLVGTATSPGGTSWQWVGRKAPALKRIGSPKWGEPVKLFNGKDLTGWRFSDPSHSSNWKVEDGVLVLNGKGSEIISTSKFMDFKLHIEFNCAAQSNSGVYLRGRDEVQIETDEAADAPPSFHTGGVYGFLAPSPAAPRKPGEWQTYDITFLGHMVTVVLNGQTIIDNREIPGITGGALDSHEELPGPLYLQGSEEGRVAYRNIVLTPAKF